MLGLSRHEPTVVAAPTPQLVPRSASDPAYAVLLLNEEQVGQLLGRQPMKQLNRSPLAGDGWIRYARLKRRLTVAATAASVVALGAAAWAWAPRPNLGAALPWTQPATPPTMPTAASFSVKVASPRSVADATMVAAQVQGLGLPAFSRRLPDSLQHQVLVGPYATLDEAESAQKVLGLRGFGASYLFVDEQLRWAPKGQRLAHAAKSNPGVLLVGAPDRLSLVMELESEPRHVSSQRISTTAMDIEVGPLASAIEAQAWTAPAGAHLVRSASFTEVIGPQGGRFLRARLELPDYARANARVEGRRIYVDLTWPQVTSTPGAQVPAAAPAPRAARAAVRAAGTAAAEPDASSLTKGEGFTAALTRFDETAPFLVSAVKAPSPDVLAALDRTLATLEASLCALPTVERTQDYQLLMTAVTTGRNALAPTFAGDRAARMRQAMSFFEGAKAQVHITPEAK